MTSRRKVNIYISKQIIRQLGEGKPQKQAVAIAYSKARREFPDYRSKLRRMAR